MTFVRTAFRAVSQPIMQAMAVTCMITAVCNDTMASVFQNLELGSCPTDDYEDDIERNSFNIYRGESAGHPSKPAVTYDASWGRARFTTIQSTTHI